MTAAQVLACIKQLDPATLNALQARTRDPRHLFMLSLVDEVQTRSLAAQAPSLSERSACLACL